MTTIFDFLLFDIQVLQTAISLLLVCNKNTDYLCI